MGLGNFNVNLDLQLLAHQKISLASLTNMISELKKQPETIAWDSISTIFKNKLGLWTKIPVTETEEKHLKEIYTETFIDKTENQIVTWYAKDEPLAVAAIDIVNKKSQLGWSTKSHSGSLVPIFAIGKGAENFTGYMLNTDIPKKIEMIVGL
jgi:alkaline phosphatase